MSPKEKIVHHQFQNAQQTVEVIVKAKSKPKLTLKTNPKHSHFTRNCILRKELEKLASEEKSGIKNQKSKTKSIHHLLPSNHVEIPKINSKKKKDPNNSLYTHPLDMTWKERLESHSSLSDTNYSVTTDDQDINKNMKNLYTKPLNAKNFKDSLICQLKPVDAFDASNNKASERQAPVMASVDLVDVSIQTSPQKGRKVEATHGILNKGQPDDNIRSTSNQVSGHTIFL